MAPKIQVIFYSMYGHIYQMAEAIAAGAREVSGADVSVYQVAELVPDDRELVEAGLEELVLEGRVAVENEAEDGRGDQHQREDGDEREVGKARRQVVALVVEELVHDRDREAQRRVPTLDSVDAAEGSSPHASTLPTDRPVRRTTRRARSRPVQRRGP